MVLSMKQRMQFNPEELLILEDAVLFSEELVSNYFKMSSGQWSRNKYDIKTARDLEKHEFIEGPYAQVIKYKALRRPASLGSSACDYYSICLQDHAILSVVDAHDDLNLYPFLLYIISHELVHVVRFGKFLQIYEKSNEGSNTIEEEQVVHHLTYDILKPIGVLGLDTVLRYYSNWRSVS